MANVPERSFRAHLYPCAQLIHRASRDRFPCPHKIVDFRGGVTPFATPAPVWNSNPRSARFDRLRDHSSLLPSAPGSCLSNQPMMLSVLAIRWLGRAAIECEAPGTRTSAVGTWRSFSAP